MWDCDLHYNRLELLNNRNPYATDTFEYVCVQYVIDNIKTFTKNRDRDIEGILQQLVKAGIAQSLDPWTLYDMPYRALWLARFCGCIAMHANESNTARPKFAVFLETGLVNLLSREDYTNFLAEMKDEERRNALWEVTYIARMITEKCYLPQMSVSENKEITIKNLNSEWFKRTHELAIPVNAFSDPEPNEAWVKIHSRGIFHHLGDEMAFIMAAQHYGECYIVGKDEFGDLVVLGRMPGSSSYANFQRVNVKNFDYIYSTPKGSEMYPSKISMVASDNDDCRINDAKNSVLENGFWRNEIFNKYAQRNLRELTVNQFLELLWDNQQAVINRPEFVAQKKAIELLSNEEKIFKTIQAIEALADYKKHPALLVLSRDESDEINGNELTAPLIVEEEEEKDVIFVCDDSDDLPEDPLDLLMSSVWHVVYQDKRNLQNFHEEFPEAEIYIENMDKSLSEHWQKVRTEKCRVITLNGIKLHVEGVLDSLMMVNDSQLYLNGFKALIDVLKNRQYQLCRTNGIESVLCGLLDNLAMELEDYLQLECLQEDNFKKALIDCNHYFYKTIAHKVHCEIINPSSTNSCGFFLKNDGKSAPDALYIHLVGFFNSHYGIYKKLVDNKTVLNNYSTGSMKDLFIEYALGRLPANTNRGDRYDQLLNYWRKLDVPALMVSDVIDMQNEYRIFMIDGRPVTASPCYRNSTPFDAWQNGRFDPRLCVGHSAKETIYSKETRSRVARYAQFARQFGREIKQAHPEIKNYVLDVAWCEDKQCVVPIEINSITWSGAYQINMHRLCAAIARKPFSYEAMDSDNNNLLSFNNIKEEARMQMLLDKVISQDQFDEFVLTHKNRYQRLFAGEIRIDTTDNSVISEVTTEVESSVQSLTEKLEEVNENLDTKVSFQDIIEEKKPDEFKVMMDRMMDDLFDGEGNIKQ